MALQALCCVSASRLCTCVRVSLCIPSLRMRVRLYQLTAAIPGATVLGPKDTAAARGLGGPVPYHLAEKRTRPSAFPLDTSLVVSDLKGPFISTFFKRTTVGGFVWLSF